MVGNLLLEKVGFLCNVCHVHVMQVCSIVYILVFIILIPASQVSDNSLQVDTGEMIWYGEGLHTRIRTLLRIWCWANLVASRWRVISK